MSRSWRYVCRGILSPLLVGEARMLADQDGDLRGVVNDYYREMSLGRTPPITAAREAVLAVAARYAAGARPYIGAPGTGPCRGSRDLYEMMDRMSEYGLSLDEAEAEASSGFCALCGAHGSCDHP